LIVANQLSAYPYKGYWSSLDTFKDKKELDELYLTGQTHWEVWKNGQIEYANAVFNVQKNQ
jgi:glucose-1-phosphate cytidylyltransferase